MPDTTTAPTGSTADLAPGFPVRVGVVDMGSNAIRLAVAEFIARSTYTVLHDDRVPIRLGASVFRNGSIEEGAFEAVLRTLERFASILADHDVEHYRVVATSAVRESDNGTELVRAAEERAGIEIEAISGAEEARLIYWAARERVHLGRGPWLLADLGGGSLEIALVDGVGLLTSESFQIGTVRLLDVFGSDGAPARLKHMIEEDLGGLRVQALEGRPRPRGYLATGGNIEDLADFVDAGRNDEGVSVVEVGALEEAVDRLAEMSVEERMDRYGFRPDRADVILPAAMVYARVARMHDMSRIHVPRVGVKEGVLYDLVQRITARPGHDARRDLDTMAGAVAFGRRFLFDEAHGVQVARLAEKFFDRLESIHELGPRDRRLLVAAAILHDVGQAISHRAHHKHGYYLISEAELPGLTSDEVELVANVARYHRKAPPSEKHESFAALSDADRDRVTRLAALLRLADALDREHAQAVSAVWVDRTDDAIRLDLVGRGDLALERWAIERKKGLFEETFGTTVVVAGDEDGDG